MGAFSQLRSQVRPQLRALTKTLEDFEHKAARTLIELASRVPPVLLERFERTIDGDRLHPQLRVLLALREAMRMTQLSATSPELARERMRRDARVHAGVPIAVGAVCDLTIPGAVGPLRARQYLPPRTQNGAHKPLLLFFHGGGFVVGDLDTHDAPCRALCRALDVVVLSVAYRLAPEHPFPAGIEDARAALRYALANAQTLGADPARVVISGDSAGGNLAAVATQQALRHGDALPALQLLIYPAVDSSKDWPSIDTFAEGYFLTRADVHQFRRQYFGGFADMHDPRASPLLATDLRGLPPAVIVTAAFDPLRDEGEAYAHALERAGVRTRLYRTPGLTHGFINMGAISSASKRALAHVAELTREFL
jgi:acetyl esterase